MQRFAVIVFGIEGIGARKQWYPRLIRTLQPGNQSRPKR